MTRPRDDAPEVGECLWANQICEQPNHHGCKTCLAVEPTRPIPPGEDDNAPPTHEDTLDEQPTCSHCGGVGHTIGAHF